MKTSSLVLLVLVIVFLVSMGSIWFYPSNQDFMAANNTWNGISDFSRRFNVTRLASLDGLESITGREVLISIPNLEYNAADLEYIRQFVEQGGNLLLMDDFGFGNDILAALGSGTRFDHAQLLDPLFCYKNPQLPYIVDFTPELQNAGSGVICLNHAAVLHLENESEALAWSSEVSYLDINSNGHYDANEPSGPFPVAASFPAGTGRVTLVSDPSLIINAMAGQKDNLAFMGRLISKDGQTMQVMLDTTHLEKSTLDTSRDKLDTFRRTFSSPYILLGLIAVIFAAVIVYSLKKGEILGQK